MSSSVKNAIKCLIAESDKVPMLCSPVCLSVNGEARKGQMLVVINKRTGETDPLGFVDPETGNGFIGTVEINEDRCNCDICVSPVHACTRLRAWDSFHESKLSAKNTQELEIILDGVSISSVVHDYLATSDGVNKSSWYIPWTDAINALDDWSILILNDAPVSTNPKVFFELKYDGDGPSSLEFRKGVPGDPNRDKYVISVSGDGSVTTETYDYSTNTPFASDPWETCEEK